MWSKTAKKQRIIAAFWRVVSFRSSGEIEWGSFLICLGCGSLRYTENEYSLSMHIMSCCAINIFCVLPLDINGAEREGRISQRAEKGVSSSLLLPPAMTHPLLCLLL